MLPPVARKVRKFIEICALKLGWGGIDWEGRVEEVGRRKDNKKIVIRIDSLLRPSEVDSPLEMPQAKEKLAGSQLKL